VKPFTVNLHCSLDGIREEHISFSWVNLDWSYAENSCNLLILWSTGRELNPRILVLQTSALATSPPVLLVLLLRAFVWRAF
jgi:hypothetical protein